MGLLYCDHGYIVEGIFGSPGKLGQRRRIIGLEKGFPTSQESEFSEIGDIICNFRPNYSAVSIIITI